MTTEIYDMLMENNTRLGKLLGTVGVFVKYDNPDLSNFEFKCLARTYIECSTDQFDIDAVRAQADKRGVDLT